MMRVILDHVPWWVWFTLTTAGVGAAFYFFHPILIPLWLAIPLPVRVGLIGLGAAIMAYFAGRNKGAQNADELRKQRDAEAIQTRLNVYREVANLDRPAVDERLAPWMRRDE